MREPRPFDRLVQIVLALLLLAPLAAIFLTATDAPYSQIQPGGSSISPASEFDPPGDSVSSARRWALAAAFGRNLCLGLAALSVALAIGIPAAWALAQRQRPLWLLVLVALPLALPASVAVSGWIGLLAPTAVSGFGFLPHGWLFSIPGAGLVLGLALWPIAAFELWPAMRRARNESYDAALLNSSPPRAFLRIILPQARPELLAAALLIFLLACNDFSVSSLLLVKTLSVEIEDLLKTQRYASAAWASLPLLATVLAASALLWRKGRRGAGENSAAGDREMRGAGRWLTPGNAALALGILLGFGLPMLVCGVQALSNQKSLSRVFGVGVDALGVSLRLAGAAAILAGLAAVFRLLVWPEMRARAVNAAALILLAAPGIFVAAALLNVRMVLGPAVPSGLAAAWPAAVLALGYLVRFIYLPLRLVEEGLAALDPELLEAAALAGHGRLSRGAAIALPLLLPHLAAALALVFILSLGEVPIAATLSSPGLDPATLWLFQQQHQGYDENVFGLSLLLGGVAALVLLLAGLAARLALRLHQRTMSR